MGRGHQSETMAEYVTNLDDAVRGLRANTVKGIDLAGDGIGDPGATALAEALKENKSVKTIDLGGNKIGDTGATALAEAVKENKSVERIRLLGNSISPKVLEAVEDAMQ